MSGTWIRTDILLDSISIWSIQKECNKDNETVFAPNNESHYDQGALRCDSFSPRRDTGYWSMTGANSFIWSTNLITIDYISEDKLVIGYIITGQDHTSKLQDKYKMAMMGRNSVMFCLLVVGTLFGGTNAGFSGE